jgi:hypothetical protein
VIGSTTISNADTDSDINPAAFHTVGKKHSRMGVKAEFFPLMGEALIQMMRDCLRDKFTPDIEAAWKEVYAALSGEMIKAMNDDITVINSWNQLKKVDNYEETAGVILFRRWVQLLCARKLSGCLPNMRLCKV